MKCTARAEKARGFARLIDAGNGAVEPSIAGWTGMRLRIHIERAARASVLAHVEFKASRNR